MWTFLNLPWQSHFFREWEILGSIKLSLCTYLKFLLCKLIQCKCVFPYHYHKYYCYGSVLPHLWKKAEWGSDFDVCFLPAQRSMPRIPSGVRCESWEWSKYRSSIPNQIFFPSKHWVSPKKSCLIQILAECSALGNSNTNFNST